MPPNPMMTASLLGWPRPRAAPAPVLTLTDRSPNPITTAARVPTINTCGTTTTMRASAAVSERRSLATSLG